MPTATVNFIDEKQSRQNSLSLALMLLGSLAMAWYNYGPRALALTAVCIAGTTISDFAGLLIVKSRKREVYDFSAPLTGLLIALMLPADFPFSFALMGCVFAVIVAKLPFGGVKGELLNPAAAGLAFLSVSRPVALFAYPKVIDHTGVFSAKEGLAAGGESLASMLQLGDSMRLNHINFFKLLTGAFPGPMGTGCIIVLLAGGFYFIFRQPEALLNFFGMITAGAALSFLFPRVLTGRLSSLVFELMSGAFIFAALFLITDQASSPVKKTHRFLYGAFAGGLAMALRYFGVFEEGVWFAVLLANAGWVVFSSPRPTFEEPIAQAENSNLDQGGGQGA
ncbi:MAG: RnfABCDGE type electron transport complex subunit D [Clostridiales bacterium]|nr:RnfABCDGE type electron transport complex subunit D [Clostridiales bacterium]